MRIFPLLDLETEEARLMQEKYDLLVESSHAVWGESAAGGGVNAKAKIEELMRQQTNKIKGNKKVPEKVAPVRRQTTKRELEPV